MPRRTFPILSAVLAPLAIACAAPGALAQSIDRLSEYSSLPESERTQVSILATPHLSALEQFDPASLGPMLERLEAWSPQVVGVERMSGALVEELARQEAFAPILEQFVGELRGLAATAQEEAGLDVYAAAAEIGRWETSTGIAGEEAARRALVAMAAYEPETALIYHPATDAGALPADIAGYLSRLAESPNERVTIGVALARALSLPRIHSIDSHEDKDLLLQVMAPLEEGLAAAGEAADPQNAEWFIASQAATREAVTAGDLLPLYRFYNAPDYQEAQIDGQFDLINRIDFPGDAGRIRQAAWDIRNLGIATAVRRASAAAPGGRVLAVIGAGHKPFLDELLAASLNVTVVQPSAYLGEAP